MEMIFIFTPEFKNRQQSLLLRAVRKPSFLYPEFVVQLVEWSSVDKSKVRKANLRRFDRI